MSRGWLILVGGIGGALSAVIVALWNILLGLRKEWREARQRVPKTIFAEEQERLGTIPLQYAGSDKAFIRLLLWIDRSVFLRPKSTSKCHFMIRDFVPPFGSGGGSGTLLVSSERELEVNLHSNDSEKIQHLIRSAKASAKARQRTLVMPIPSGQQTLFVQLL